MESRQLISTESTHLVSVELKYSMARSVQFTDVEKGLRAVLELFIRRLDIVWRKDIVRGVKSGK